MQPLQVVEGPSYRVPADSLQPLNLRFHYNASLPEDVAFVEDLRASSKLLTVHHWTEFDWQLYFVSYLYECCTVVKCILKCTSIDSRLSYMFG